MESVLFECTHQNGGEPTRHISPAVVRSKRIVTKIAGAEVASHYFTDIDDAGQLALFGNNPISEMSLFAECASGRHRTRRKCEERTSIVHGVFCFFARHSGILPAAGGKAFREYAECPRTDHFPSRLFRVA